MTPVTKGQPIYPHMTAEWYNQTLPSTQRRMASPGFNFSKQVFGLATGAINRFEAVGPGTPLNKEQGHNINLTTPTACKWGVAQEDGVADKPTPIVLFGLTFAWVTINSGSDQWVTYDSGLVTSSVGLGRIVSSTGETDSGRTLLLITVGHPVPNGTIMGLRVDSNKLQYKPVTDCAEGEWTDLPSEACSVSSS